MFEVGHEVKTLDYEYLESINMGDLPPAPFVIHYPEFMNSTSS